MTNTSTITDADILKKLSVQLADEGKLMEAREAFLNVIADATRFENEIDADADDDGRAVVTSEFHLTTGEQQLRELWTALGFSVRFDESLDDAITREVETPPAALAATEGGE